jgi:ABC-2 type transport system ATP-binding protein
MYGIKKKDRITETILKLVSLDQQSKSYTRTLSGGMKRRLLVAKALVHKPPIIILDEPTAGVDVELRSKLWDNLKQLNKQGVTIILTTHYLNEAEQMCNRIGILNKGKLVALDTTKNLLKRIQTKIVKFAVDKKVYINNNSLKSINILSNETGELVVSYEKNALNINEIIKFINDQNIKLLDISTDDGDLEDVFIRLTKN